MSSRAEWQAIDKVVAQVSKPAVSQGFQPADAAKPNPPLVWEAFADLEIGDTAGLETWFGNLRYGPTLSMALGGMPLGIFRCPFLPKHGA
ncbi:MAG: hypothetical protein L0Z50_04990 [Verrucomicrobiales bacterium]|nr:hypothetical protein [Verrucomicrobiales bacterium]